MQSKSFIGVAKSHLSLIVIVAIYLIVTFPFGLTNDRHPLLNLEPYPDSFGYLLPVHNLIHGGGFNYSYNGHVIPQRMPPLYSIILLPLFFIFHTPASFYFTNLFLGVISLLGLYSLVKKITSDHLVITSALGLYMSHGYVLFVASTPMAENLILPLFIWSLNLLLAKPKTTFQAFLASFCVTGLLLTKYAYAFIGLAFGILFIVKYVKLKLFKQALKFIFFCLFFLMILYIYQARLNWSSLKFIAGFKTFSVDYFINSMKFYISAISGQLTSFLWLRWPLTSLLFLLMGIFLLLKNLFGQTINGLTSLVILYVAHLLMVGFYFYLDARFLITIIVINILFFVKFLVLIKDNQILKLATIVFTFFVMLLSQKGLYRQLVGQNIFGSSHAWHYEAVQSIARFMDDKPESVIITALHPPLFSLYIQKNINLLPISNNQEFYGDQIWGKIDIAPAQEIRNRINNGQAVYVSNAYITAVPVYVLAFEQLRTEYKFDLEQSGCLETCNIYSLSLM